MNIKAKIGEQQFSLAADSEDVTIEDLKKQLETQSNIAYQAQKWVFQGRILTDKSTLKQCNLKDDSCVIVIKSAQPSTASSSIQGNNAAVNIAQTSIPSPIIVDTRGFDRAMHLLLDNSPQIVEDAVGLLLKVAMNIINNPSEDKYRRLGSTNATFIKKLGSVKGGVSCMEGLGFRLQGTDWMLTPSPEAWEALIQCKTKLDKFAAKLKTMNASSVSTSSSETKSSSIESTTDVSNTTTSSSSTTTPASTTTSAPEVVLMQQLIHALQIQNANSLSSGNNNNNNNIPSTSDSSSMSNTNSSQSFSPVFNTPPPLPPTIWQNMKLGDIVITKTGVKPISAALSGKKLIGLYFSAHWCPPVRIFYIFYFTLHTFINNTSIQ